MKSKILLIAVILVTFFVGFIAGGIVDLTPEYKYYRTTQVISYRGSEGVQGVIPKGSVLALSSIAREKLAFMKTGVILDASRLSEHTEPIIVRPDTYDQHRYMIDMYKYD